MKKDLETKEEIHQLVDYFYTQLRKDKLLAPIFLKVIPDSHWNGHILKITDFWSSILFSNMDYSGNPMETHIKLDKTTNYQIDQTYFDRWLEIWYESIDELFAGKNANILKDRARNIAHIMWIKIFSTRKA